MSSVNRRSINWKSNTIGDKNDRVEIGEVLGMCRKVKRSRSKFWMKPRFLLPIIPVSLLLLFVLYVSMYQPCYEIELPERPLLEGPLAVNERLSKAKHLLKDRIEGPESILVEGNILYTGTADGKVLKIRGEKIVKEIRFTNNTCGDYVHEPLCGRPLGIRRLNSDELVVMDAYLGIYSVNFERGSFKQLFEGGKVVNNEPVLFLNDVDVVNDDFIVFTHSSSRWDRRRFLKIFFEGVPNGRVLSLVPSTRKVRVIMDNLLFPNGIQLFPDKESILVAECGMARIKRHWISGVRNGKTDIFSENLPGFPDNIRLSLKNTFWVGLASVRRKEGISIFDFLARNVFLRKLALRIIPDHILSKMLHLKPPHSIIVELNENGKIISSAHDIDGNSIQLNSISQVSDSKDYLFLGSFDGKSIVQIPKTEE